MAAYNNNNFEFPSNSDISTHLVRGLTNSIRDSLRARVLEAIEPNINEAIDHALQDFKATIEGYCNPSMMENVIKVLIERK